VDASAVTIDGPEALRRYASGNLRLAETRQCAISILNKTDLLDNGALTLQHAEILEKDTNIVCLSALREHGLEELFDMMSRILGLDILKRRFQPQLFNKRQLTMIVELRTALEHCTWNPHIFQRFSGYIAGSAEWIG
jgi:50S ribosomal subunit-associated GTPase HflX